MIVVPVFIMINGDLSGLSKAFNGIAGLMFPVQDEQWQTARDFQ